MRSICVYCGSSSNVHADYLAAARRMGTTLARHSIRLIYGGGGTGLMGALANAALAADGEVIGVIVESMNTPALAHSGLTHLEVTSTIHQRKARMSELADGFIALPGGFGTLDELFEAATWAQIGIHRKPIGLLNVRNYFDPLLSAINHAEKEGFIFPEHRQMIGCETDPETLLTTMENHVHPVEAVKRWLRQN
jgi:uncharacterized protein (TIGR00730 family)